MEPRGRSRGSYYRRERGARGLSGRERAHVSTMAVGGSRGSGERPQPEEPGDEHRRHQPQHDHHHLQRGQVGSRRAAAPRTSSVARVPWGVRQLPTFVPSSEAASSLRFST